MASALVPYRDPQGDANDEIRAICRKSGSINRPPVEVLSLCAALCVMERIGVRHLRQNLSVYLQRVKKGERMEVTEHGQTVALLVPKSAQPETDEEWLERMQAEGRISRGGGNLAALGLPPPAPPGAKPLSHALQEMRDEDPR